MAAWTDLDRVGHEAEAAFWAVELEAVVYLIPPLSSSMSFIDYNADATELLETYGPSRLICVRQRLTTMQTF